jgi:hypothetical protein
MGRWLLHRMVVEWEQQTSAVQVNACMERQLPVLQLGFPLVLVEAEDDMAEYHWRQLA